ncbi:sucrose-specific PTS transporter subunit IIBC [Clostridium saccharoperbutylacetonicum]|uniref:sucrose-specific PTS transporter subunit IIBC n=1 Tax=Clostridium saccharoperbutylacetonicum TaxID=36745 RepID=UPI000983C4E8|nr:sucrose-specific PTS transporter subunit IIBC [Clostridium saccharoperbutylacetonicum]AQR94550.1 negative regulator of SacY activity [Clostridium saccharoperbutylacetonicum]NSB30386.1 PTS system sucrose-specific IIC component [Clostridium saccharoperbutylacetonicum]
MTSKESFKNTAKDILVCVGGKENVTSAAHCATRLRLVLHDDKKVNLEKIEEINLVKGCFNNRGQFQIILGTGIVDAVYEEFAKLSYISEASVQELKKVSTAKLNIIQRTLSALADVFVPILPALVASGLLMGLNNVLTAKGLFISNISLVEVYPQFSQLAEMLNLFSNAAFTFLPIFIGFSAAKRFGGTPVLGAVIGGIMIHPDLLNGYGYGKALIDGTVPYWNIFGLSIAKVGYQGTVLPVIVSCFVLAKLEGKLHKIVRPILDNIITPLVSVLVTAALTFIIIGPVMRTVGNFLTAGVMWLFFDLGPIGGAIYGVVYPLLVITGMHHSLITAETQILANISTLGGSPTFAVVAASNVAQGAAALAVLITVKKDIKIKSIASASGISALLGITEPAMFGINLKLKYPFIGALIGSAVGSAYATFMKVLSLSQGPAGLPGIIVIRPQSMIQYMISLCISFGITFIMTILLGKKWSKKA